MLNIYVLMYVRLEEQGVTLSLDTVAKPFAAPGDSEPAKLLNVPISPNTHQTR